VTFPCPWQKMWYCWLQKNMRGISETHVLGGQGPGGCPVNVSKCLETEMVNEVDLICLEYIVAMDNSFWTLTFWPTD
jgi:hypothetical protein